MGIEKTKSLQKLNANRTSYCTFNAFNVEQSAVYTGIHLEYFVF